MKLFYSPGACSMADHIILEEAGFRYEIANTAASDRNRAELEKLNPNGAVPVLLLDDGSALTQNVAILVYLAEQKPEAKLLPPPGTAQRARTLEWLAFVNSDVHPAFGQLFGEDVSSDIPKARAHVTELLDIADKRLAGKGPFCIGETFTIADAYLFVVTGWAEHLKVDMKRWPQLATHARLVAARPAVQRVMKSEGLAKAS